MKAMIINPPFPQLIQLAEHWSHDGQLARYATPFLHRDNDGTAILKRLGTPGRRFVATLQKRSTPRLSPSTEVIQGGTVLEAMRQTLLPVTRSNVGPLAFARDQLMYHRNEILSIKASNNVSGLQVVVASFGTGLESFQNASLSCLRVLDYPLAYHREVEAILIADTFRTPEFAGTMQNHNTPKKWRKRLDEEVRIADIVLVGSRFVKQSFINWGFPQEKFHVVPYGTSTGMLSRNPAPQQQQDSFTVLFVGQIGQRKGISYLLDAYHAFKQSDTQLHLIGTFVGNTDCYNPYRNDFTHFPKMPQADLVSRYRSASVLVLPSLAEGMPLVVIEALANGLPVIVTNTGADEVVVDDYNGYVVPTGSAIAIEERLRRMYNDTSLRNRLSQNARISARRYTATNYVSGINSIILPENQVQT